MSDDPTIPQTYEQWVRCVTKRCGLTLSDAYLQSRLQSLRDGDDPHTREFIRCYGHAHLERVIGWCYRAQFDR